MKTRTVRLSEIITEMDSGGRPKGGAADSGVLSVGGEHIGADGSFLLESRRFVPADFFGNMRRGKVQQNDILIVKDGATTGKVAFVDGGLPLPAAVNEHVFRLAVDPSVAEPRYVFYYLLGPVGNGQILEDFRGATVGGISQDFTEKVEFPLPSLLDQRRIAAMLDEANRLRRTRRYAIELSDTILPAAFSAFFGGTVASWCKWPRKSFDDLLRADLRNGLSPSKAGTVRAKVLTLSAITGGSFDGNALKSALFGKTPPEDTRVYAEDFLVCRGNGNLTLVGRGEYPSALLHLK